MQRILSSPTFLLMFLCSYAWTSQFPSADEIDSVRRLVLYGSSPRRFQLFEYGRRPFEEDRESLEDFSSIPSTNIDYYNDLDKRVVGNGNKYTFGLGKRSKSYGFGLGKRAKAYGFGLGKRLQKDWKNSPALLSPNYRYGYYKTFLLTQNLIISSLDSH